MRTLRNFNFKTAQRQGETASVNWNRSSSCSQTEVMVPMIELSDFVAPTSAATMLAATLALRLSCRFSAALGITKFTPIACVLQANLAHVKLRRLSHGLHYFSHFRATNGLSTNK